MKKILFPLFIAALLLGPAASYAQVRSEAALQMLRENPNRAGINAHVYEFIEEKDTPAPSGYKPFYISHYGRHGARTDFRAKDYVYVASRLGQAQQAGILNADGAYLLEKTQQVLADYAGMSGRLTRRGEYEHRELARRIYNRYPAVFKKGSGNLRIKSTTVPRVLVSGSNFLAQLTSMQPSLRYTFDTGERYMQTLSNSATKAHRRKVQRLLDSLSRVPCDTTSLYTMLFTDGAAARRIIPDADAFQQSIFATARISESMGIADDLYRFLPEDALYKWWDRALRSMYVQQANSVEWGAERMEGVEPLVRCILADAEDALSAGNVAADLKFGHDYPLLALCGYLGLSGVGERLRFDEIPFKWCDPRNITFASNLQLVFYRSPKGGDILVKAVYNGVERSISGLKPVSGPYYKWKDLKDKCESRLAWRTRLVPLPAYVERGEGLHACRGLETKLDPSLGAEAYELDTRGPKVLLRGGGEAGLFYGMQTLAQIRNQHPDDAFPSLLIKDKPRFAWRGAMLDCCRHFFTVDEVKAFIDILALHKLNVFHWHLTDDQGWRAEIRKYPRLTEVGSVRRETVIGNAKWPKGYDGIPHGGFYTQDQMREVVAYAAERQITVVPEIEMPGHALAALASYPALGCTGGPYETSTTFGVFKDIFCVGKDETLQFLFDVLDEICEIFPSEFIHIGGDEAPRVRWEACPHCQARIRAERLAGEAQLQSWLIRKVEAHLAQKGRKILGWDEILDGGVDKSTMVQSWRGSGGGKRAASLGNKVIMSPNTYMYLDYYQTTDPEAYGESFGIGKYLPLDKVYAFDPYEGLKEREQVFIYGVQANVWTEYLPSLFTVQERTLPRLAAAAEVAWSPAGRESYANFLDRCRYALLPLYAEAGWHWAPYAFADYENLK